MAWVITFQVDIISFKAKQMVSLYFTEQLPSAMLRFSKLRIRPAQLTENLVVRMRSLMHQNNLDIT